ncbi:MAG: hypothetical protein ACKOZW_13865 [Cyanobium sp.]
MDQQNPQGRSLAILVLTTTSWPRIRLAEGDHDKKNLPDCLARWRQRKDAERQRERTAQSSCVPKEERR